MKTQIEVKTKEIEKIEKKPQEKEEEEKPEEDVYTGNDMIKKAEISAQRLEKANEQLERNLKKMEQIGIERSLGGKSIMTSQVIKEESPVEFANRFLNEGKDNILFPMKE